MLLIIATIEHGFTFATFFGLLAAVLIGVFVGSFLDRSKSLNALRSHVAMIREDIELSSDTDWRDRSAANSIQNVWERSVPSLQKTIYAALPNLLTYYEKERLMVYWVSIRDFDIAEFYEARSTEELIDRVIYALPTETKKQAILRALSMLEQRIGTCP